MDTNVMRGEYRGECCEGYRGEHHGESGEKYRGERRGEYKVPGGKLVAVTVGADGADGVNGADWAVGVNGADGADGADGAARRHVRIDGDFFVESESDAQSGALLRDIEHVLSDRADALAGSASGVTDVAVARDVAVEGPTVVRDVIAMVAEAIARHPGAHLVGTDAAAIATAYARAVGVPTETGTDAAASASRPGASTAAHAASAPAAPAESGASVSSLIPAATPESVSSSYAPATSIPSTPTSAIPSTPAPDPATSTESDDFADRWARLWPELAIIHDVPRPPAEQMRLDEAWARDVAAGLRPPTLRIWEWSGSCVVVGRFQSIPDEVHEDVARAEGIEVVRRCTGGGAMFIEPGNTITYSLYAPLWFVEGMDVARSYRLCDRWLVGALRGMGLDVRFSGLNDIASQHGKIGGAAQRRFPAGAAGTGREDGPGPEPCAAHGAGAMHGAFGAGRGPGAVLHHVTMAYDIDAAKMGRVLNTSKEKMRDKAVRSAVKRVDPLKSQTGLDRGEVIARMLAYARSHARGLVRER